MRTILIISLVGLITPGTPLRATDYSNMFDPRFARILVLPAKPVQQAECAGLALHFGESRPTFSKEMAARIADAVTRRLSVDLDDETIARELVETKAANHTDIGYEPETRADVVDILEGHCRTLFDEAAKGDAALNAALGSMPSEPIKLPDPGQCLGVMTYAAERDGHDPAKQFKVVLKEAWIDEAAAAERAARKAKVTTAISMLRSMAPTNYTLHDMVFSCMPTMKDVISNSKKMNRSSSR